MPFFCVFTFSFLIVLYPHLIPPSSPLPNLFNATHCISSESYLFPHDPIRFNITLYSYAHPPNTLYIYDAHASILPPPPVLQLQPSPLSALTLAFSFQTQFIKFVIQSIIYIIFRFDVFDMSCLTYSLALP
ncbi:hypothetical protein BJ165DRAFT_636097 [Panaeolus papilionaceus]|nr:hypothetical protein BJ165DRAFT_636097 [Panaeolus papilionaceus]